MSKKSRKRNKRLLMLAALAGGAAFLGRGKKKFGTDAGFLKSGAAGGASLAADAAPKTQWIKKKKVDAPVIKPDYITKKPADDSWLDVPPGVHGSGGKGDMWRKIKDAQYETGAMPDVNLDPYKIPTKRVMKRGVDYRMKAGGRIGANKGGSVTGIAKRGFGRALMKWKK